MSLGEVKIKLNLDGRDMEIGIHRANKLIRELKNAVNAASGSLESSQQTIGRWARNLRHASLTLAAIPFALDTMNRMFLSLPTSIVKANAELERLNQLMIGLSKSSESYAEAQVSAAKSMEYLIGMADSTPFDLQALTDGMVKFKSAGLDPLNGSFQALVDSVAKYGGSSQHLHRASIAIQQMSGKGVISMEELRQQLGEAVPDAINQMARSMGVSMGELVDKISRGTVESQNAIAAMMNQMAFESIGAAKAMSQTWDGLMGRLRLQWMLLLKEMGDSGSFEELKKNLEQLVQVLGTPQAKAMAREFGEQLRRLVVAGREVLNFIIEYRSVIAELIKVYITFNILNSQLVQGFLGGTVRAVSAATQSFSAFRQSVQANRAAIAVNVAELHKLERVKARLIAASAGASNQLVTQALNHRIAAQAALIQAQRNDMLEARISAVSGAIVGGLRAMATATVATAVFTAGLLLLSKAYDLITGAQRRYTQVVEDGTLAYSKSQLQKYKDDMVQMEIDLNTKRAEVDRLKAKADQTKRQSDYTKYFNASLELRQLEQNYQTFQSIIERSTETIISTNASIAASALDAAKQAELADIARPYVKAMDEVSKAQALGVITREYAATQLANLREQEKTAIIENLDAEIQANFAATEAVLEAKALRASSRGSTEELDQEIASLNAKKEILTRLRDTFAALRTENFDMVLTTGASKGASYGENSPISRFLDSTTAKVEGLREELMGGISDIAKFEVMLAAGKYGSVSGSEADKVREQLQLLGELKQRREEQKKSEQEIQSSQTVLANLTGRVNAEMERLNESSNPWLQLSAGSRQAEKSLAQMVEKFAQAKELTPEMAAEQERIVDAMKDMVQQQRELDALNAMKSMSDQAKELNKGLLTQRELLEANYQEAQAYLSEFYLLNQALIEQSPEMQAVFENYRAALERDYVRATEHAAKKVLREWSDVSSAMDKVWSSAMNGMSRSLTDFLVKGKTDFKGFLEDIVAMIVQAQINKYMAQAFSGIGGGGGGLLETIVGAAAGMFNFGGSAAAPGSSVTGEVRLGFANGGILDQYGSVPLRKYANGGIAHHPQLAVYGEGSRPEAFVPLPDGRTIPVTLEGGGQSAPIVNVNVINQSGQQMQAEESGRSFDGEKMVLDIVLKAAQQPGKFRSGLKGAMRS